MEGTVNWPLVEWRWCTLYFSSMWKFFLCGEDLPSRRLVLSLPRGK